MVLPPIRLLPAVYYRVRFVTRAGEPIAVPLIVRQALEDTVRPAMAAPPPTRRPDDIAPDGTATIGPLPRGVTRLAFDTPPHARMRLPDVRVTGTDPVLDGGTVVVEPGGRLEVDVIDAAGEPVPDHAVYLEDAVPLSPLSFPPGQTDRQGRVTFERLSSGRYRLHARSNELCGRTYVSIAREITATGSGTTRARLVIDGLAQIRVTSSGIPLTGTSILAWPGTGPGPDTLPFWLRGRFGAPCPGVTDRNGLATFTGFPPGPARVDVRLPNSTWIRRITVPTQRRDVRVEIPAGYFPLRALDATTGAPVPRASVTWLSAGMRIESTTSVSGEALLDGVAAEGGTLRVEAEGYEAAQMKLPEPPGILYDVALAPARGRTFECRVLDESGEPLPGAVVELIPADPVAPGHVATTDARGIASFFDSPKGAFRLVGRADRHAASRTDVPADTSSAATMRLRRGYRVIVRVEPGAGDGPFAIGITNEAGTPVDHLLDAASDRIALSSSEVSLGPLLPGRYLLKLRGPGASRQQRVEVQHGDVRIAVR
jgi:hypothetical protein